MTTTALGAKLVAAAPGLTARAELYAAAVEALRRGPLAAQIRIEQLARGDLRLLLALIGADVIVKAAWELVDQVV